MSVRQKINLKKKKKKMTIPGIHNRQSDLLSRLQPRGYSLGDIVTN